MSWCSLKTTYRMTSYITESRASGSCHQKRSKISISISFIYLYVSLASKVMKVVLVLIKMNWIEDWRYLKKLSQGKQATCMIQQTSIRLTKSHLIKIERLNLELVKIIFWLIFKVINWTFVIHYTSNPIFLEKDIINL